MATRRVKLEISLKELSVKFEGDLDTAQSIQEAVSRSINALADVPNNVIDATPHDDLPALVPSTAANMPGISHGAGVQSDTTLNQQDSASASDNRSAAEALAENRVQ